MTKWFGEFAYRYSGVTRPAVPWDEVPHAVQSVQSAVEREVFGTSTGWFNGVLLNYSRSGDDKLGWHADDEKDILRDAPIASVSFEPNVASSSSTPTRVCVARSHSRMAACW